MRILCPRNNREVQVIARERCVKIQSSGYGCGGTALREWDEAGLADALVVGEQAQAFDDGRGSEDAVLRVAGVGGGKCDGAGGDLGRDGQKLDVGCALLHERRRAEIGGDAAVFDQPGDLPEADGGKKKRACFSRGDDLFTAGRGELFRREQHPDEDVGVEQDHSTPQSLAEAVVSMSPTMRAEPRSAPKRSSVVTGTSFATGFPCLVMTTGAPLCATWSMTARHWALNWAAGMARMVVSGELPSMTRIL